MNSQEAFAASEKNYSEALAQAKRTANKSRCSVLVYRSTLRDNWEEPHAEQYGVAFTLPTFGQRVGERIEPEEEYEPEMRPALARYINLKEGRTKGTTEEIEAARVAAEEESAVRLTS